MSQKIAHGWRFYSLLVFLSAAILGLSARIVYLGVIKRDFLVDQSTARSVRENILPAHRGIITDRNNKPLAISTQVSSIWVNPKTFGVDAKQLTEVAALLDVSVSSINNKVNHAKDREFVYLKRGVPPDIAEKVLALHIVGLYSQAEYKRYYPEAETTAHVVGFTNIDDRGQEGLELAYDSWLRGVPGKMRVIKDRLGNVIADLGVVTEPQAGHDLTLSIDRRIQYLAYSEIKNTVEQYQADSGSAVVLNVKTGEVLAMVNEPTYNPNNRANETRDHYRNRAATDLFEPGSTMKAFSIASALDSGKYYPTTLINTNPGVLRVDGHDIYDNDHRNNKVLTVTEVLKKSSDIGVAKITLSLPPNRLLSLLHNVGFGRTTQSGYPGEGAGMLPDDLHLRPFVLATIAFGYGISATTLQLAQAYAVIASGGLLRQVTFVKVDKDVPGKQVMNPHVAQLMMTMLETVIDIGGTGTRAQIHGYRVAGKTGTAHIAAPHGYYKDRYFALFVGIAPVTDPELVVAVVIKNPHGLYHGGSVAAPAFAKIMGGALRVLDIPPDDISGNATQPA